MSAVQDRVRAHLVAGASGETAPNIALMHAILAADAPRTIDERLPECGSTAAGREIIRLWRETPQAFALVKAIAAAVDHECRPDPGDGWRDAFDVAARLSPWAGVALYTLGRADLLEAATASIVTWLRAEHLIDDGMHVLDLGCGSGRLSRAIAPHVRSIVGIDVSPVMLAAARSASADLDTLAFVPTDGRDLGLFADATFDLVVAADVFPYLHGTARAHVVQHLAECARVLRPSGALAILNYVYGSDFDRELAAVRDDASRAGLDITASSAGRFALWDGTSFVLRPGVRGSAP